MNEVDRSSLNEEDFIERQRSAVDQFPHLGEGSLYLKVEIPHFPPVLPLLLRRDALLKSRILGQTNLECALYSSSVRAASGASSSLIRARRAASSSCAAAVVVVGDGRRIWLLAACLVGVLGEGLIMAYCQYSLASYFHKT